MGKESGSTFPTWARAAAGLFGGITIIFLMVLVVLSVYGREVPSSARFLVVSVVAFGLALSSAFIGGDAAAKGKIRILPLQRNPVVFSATGGVAAFIIILSLGNHFYPTPTDEEQAKQILKIVDQLRENFNGAMRALGQKPTPDLSSADRLFTNAGENINVLAQLDNQNGHAWYFAGTIKRIKNGALFDTLACPKRVRSLGEDHMDAYRQDFLLYLEGEKKRPPSEKGDDLTKEICYRRSKGYCAQRTGWVHHLLANDFYEEALAASDPDERAVKLNSAREQAGLARAYYPPNGFVQCIDTRALLAKIAAVITVMSNK